MTPDVRELRADAPLPDTDEARRRSWQDPDRPLDQRVELLLAQMSLAQKTAQLGSYWRPHGAPGEEVAPMEGELAEGVRSFADHIEHGLGQLTRVFGSVPVTVAEGIRDLRDMQREVLDAPGGLGIPAIAHEECLTGFTALGATVYPTSLAWGATFDPELIREMSAAIGRDMSAVGIHQGLSPVLDVTRDYRWGRTEETIGEDPYLVGMLGTAYVQGLQSAGVIATLKHFVGYSASRAARNHAPVSVGGRELADVLLVPFEMAVREGGVRSVMNSYADVDGVAPAASRELLTTVLRERWGFTGTVVSDYWAVTFLEVMHRIAATPAEAARLALTAGMDVELPETGTFAHLPELVRTGALDEAVLDTAVRRVLLQKAELGLLDADWAPPAPDTAVDLDSAANRALARRMAEKSVVLAANDGILPLTPGTRIAVIGPSAGDPRTFLGCYSFPNHVLSRHTAHGTGIDVPTLLDSLRSAHDGTVTDERGCGILDTDTSGIAAAVAAARNADIALVTVGDVAGLFGRGTSGEGCDAADLSLPGVQGELIEAVLDTGVPVVLVVVSGRPYALGRFADRCAAIVQAFFPGEEGGPALAAVLRVPRNRAGGCRSAFRATRAASRAPTWPRRWGSAPRASPISTRPRSSPSATACPTAPSSTASCERPVGPAERRLPPGRRDGAQHRRPALRGGRPAVPERPLRAGRPTGAGADRVRPGGTRAGCRRPGDLPCPRGPHVVHRRGPDPHCRTRPHDVRHRAVQPPADRRTGGRYRRPAADGRRPAHHDHARPGRPTLTDSATDA